MMDEPLLLLLDGGSRKQRRLLKELAILIIMLHGALLDQHRLARRNQRLIPGLARERLETFEIGPDRDEDKLVGVFWQRAPNMQRDHPCLRAQQWDAHI